MGKNVCCQNKDRRTIEKQKKTLKCSSQRRDVTNQDRHTRTDKQAALDRQIEKCCSKNAIKGISMRKRKLRHKKIV